MAVIAASGMVMEDERGGQLGGTVAGSGVMRQRQATALSGGTLPHRLRLPDCGYAVCLQPPSAR